MAKHTEKNHNRLTSILWLALPFLLLAVLFARALVPELSWLTVILLALLVANLALLVQQNRKALRTRSAAYGLNSLVTVILVIAITGVVNFLVSRYPGKLDLTKNKVHTLSEQTVKVVRGLNKEIKANFFAKLSQREQYRPLLDNYRHLNPGKFEVEFIDPDREPTRAKQAGIRKYGTLQLVLGARDTKIEDLSEEKITNALIKLMKDREPTFCAITGHGERNFDASDADGYDAAKKAMGEQAYQVKAVNLLQEGKIPDSCDAIGIMGPTKAFFAPEVKLIKDYVDNGGRAVIAIDLNIRGAEYAPELLPVLEAWHVKPSQALIVDPLSRLMGVDAAVPILATYSKQSPITKDFSTNCIFPFSRPLEILPGAPGGMTVSWLSKTNPKSWGVTNLKSISSGRVAYQPGKDEQGPLNVAIAVDGKLPGSKASKSTRLVVFGTSHFANNNYQRFGGNLDFFMNAVSWVMEDEGLISIRAKDEGPGRVELSQKTANFIFMLTVFAIPFLIAGGGIVIWAARRRL